MACKRSVRRVSQFRRRLRADRKSTLTSYLILLSIACPLVVAQKATAPFVRHCGDYRPIVALYGTYRTCVPYSLLPYEK
jgi:hypothetical protein